MMTIAKRLDKHFAACAAAGAALLTGVQQSDAAVVFSGIVNLNIPLTTNGLYLNVVTGLINEPGNGTGASVPGWDVNPWSSTALNYFSPATGAAYISRLGGGATANIGPAGIVDANPVGQGFGAYASSTAATIGNNPHLLNSNQNFIGFRFFREGDVAGTFHYGWMQLQLSTALNTTRLLVQYAYEDQVGVAIQVPGPGALSLIGLAGLTGRGRRRR